jgi:hypothetical protein
MIVPANVNKDKSILMYHHSFIVQRDSTTYLDFQEFIFRRTYKNSVLILEFYFNIDPNYYKLFYFL